MISSASHSRPKGLLANLQQLSPINIRPTGTCQQSQVIRTLFLHAEDQDTCASWNLPYSHYFSFDVSVASFTTKNTTGHPLQGCCDIVCIKDCDILQQHKTIAGIQIQKKSKKGLGLLRHLVHCLSSGTDMGIYLSRYSQRIPSAPLLHAIHTQLHIS